MRVSSFVLVFAAADTCILSQEGVVDLSTKTVAFFADVVSIVGQGLYVEGSKLAGPAAMKEFHGKIDLVQMEFKKGKKTVMPHFEKVKSEVMKQYDTASAAVAPQLTKLNAMLDKPIKEFKTKLPAHAELLVADSLVDKVLLLSWLVFTLTFCFRILNFCLGLVFKIIFFPCRLLCGKRASKDAPASGKGKKDFKGNAQTKGNGPTPKKK
jgi:hypothetical protein